MMAKLLESPDHSGSVEKSGFIVWKYWSKYRIRRSKGWGKDPVKLLSSGVDASS